MAENPAAESIHHDDEIDKGARHRDVGASGVGKSSVVRAGVIPALRRGGIPGSERWHCVVMRPVNQPVRALFESLAAVTSSTAPVLSDETVHSAVLERHLKDLDNRYLPVIDQFEELFARCYRSDRAQFIQVLMDIVMPSRMGLGSAFAQVRRDHRPEMVHPAPEQFRRRP
jgi:hypothetical protein